MKSQFDVVVLCDSKEDSKSSREVPPDSNYLSRISFRLTLLIIAIARLCPENRNKPHRRLLMSNKISQRVQWLDQN